MAALENRNEELHARETEGERGGSGANQSNPEGITDPHQRDFRDPHGNQTLRQPSGGSGAGESRGDASSFNPAPATGPGEVMHDADPIEESNEDGSPRESSGE